MEELKIDGTLRKWGWTESMSVALRGPSGQLMCSSQGAKVRPLPQKTLCAGREVLLQKTRVGPPAGKSRFCTYQRVYKTERTVNKRG